MLWYVRATASSYSYIIAFLCVQTGRADGTVQVWSVPDASLVSTFSLNHEVQNPKSLMDQ